MCKRLSVRSFKRLSPLHSYHLSPSPSPFSWSRTRFRTGRNHQVWPFGQEIALIYSSYMASESRQLLSQVDFQATYVGLSADLCWTYLENRPNLGIQPTERLWVRMSGAWESLMVIMGGSKVQPRK